MKAAPFDYARPRSLDEVLELLSGSDPEPRLIAGGQTLVPLMAMRLAEPGLLIDLNAVQGLDGLRVEPDAVVLGATLRQARALAAPLVARHLPLLAAALAHVGHPPTRNRGTLGGSIVTGDPAAEIPLVCRVLDARLRLVSRAGVRDVDAADFFLGPLVTAVDAGECLTEVRLPRWEGEGLRIGCGFEEMAVRQGDFALVAAAAQVALDAQGRCVRAAAGVANVADTVVRADTAALRDRRPDAAAVDAVCASVEPMLDPPSDLHAGAAYRRRLATGLLRRALLGALGSANGVET